MVTIVTVRWLPLRADIEAAIAGAMAEGMSRADAIAKYQPIVLDPACMMGISLGKMLNVFYIVLYYIMY